jgi:hypothetical protein
MIQLENYHQSIGDDKMSLDDQRYYEVLYGFYPVHWSFNFGTFSAHHHILDTGYIDPDCDIVESSSAHITTNFMYPFYTKKIYFIEGVIKGQIAYEASGASTQLISYTVSLCKMGSDNSTSVLATTGVITVNKTMLWVLTPLPHSNVTGIFPFWIDCSQEKEVSDKERLYLKIEAVCSNTSCILLHANDPSHIDLKVEIPIRG